MEIEEINNTPGLIELDYTQSQVDCQEIETGYMALELTIDTNLDEEIKTSRIIQKSSLDKRDYFYRTLENGLKILIISDPTVKFSACAFRVDTGSYEDPDEYSGLAHFLEHMLFLGSKKYPDSDEYNNFFSKHGGYTNAWTDDDYTTYNFDIAEHEEFYNALDRTTEFFISPLFTEKYVDKELNAVDSEFKMDFQDDSWRYWSVMGQLSSPGSKIAKFNIGNRQTLEKPGLREALIKFWKEKYSANLMHVILISNQSCSQIFKKASQILLKVENRNIIPFTYKQMPHPYGPAQKKKLVQMNTIKDENLLKFMFILPVMNDTRKNQSIVSYFTHLFESEHKGSMCQILKDKKLSQSTSTSISDSVDQFTSLSIDIYLTDVGLKEIETIVKIVGNYIRYLKTEGPQQEFYTSIVEINEYCRKYDPKIEAYEYVTQLVDSIQNPEIETILYFDVTADFDYQMIDEIFKANFAVENLIVVQSGKDLKFESNAKEHYFEVEFRVEELPACYIEWFESEDYSGIFRKANKNRFIPKTFDLVSASEEVTFPSSASGHLFTYYRCSDHSDPKCVLNFQQNHKSVDKKSTVFKEILALMMEKHFSEEIYEASLTNLGTSISGGQLSLSISINCFSDSLIPYLDVLIEKMEKEGLEFLKDQSQFSTCLSTIKQDYENSLKEDPSELSDTYMYRIVFQNGVDPREQNEFVKQLDDSCFHEFQVFLGNYFDQATYETVFVGNLSREIARECSVKLERLFDSLRDMQKKSIVELEDFRRKHICDLKKVTQKSTDVSKLGQRTHPLFRVKSLVETGKVTGITYVMKLKVPEGVSSDVKTLANVIQEIFSEEFYNELRTQHQLGYVCNTSVANFRGHFHMVCCVQGGDHNPHYYARMIEEFWDNGLHHIEKLKLTLAEIKEQENAKKAESNEDDKKSTSEDDGEEGDSSSSSGKSDSKSSSSESESEEKETDLTITKLEKLKKTMKQIYCRLDSNLEDEASTFKNSVYDSRWVLSPEQLIDFNSQDYSEKEQVKANSVKHKLLAQGKKIDRVCYEEILSFYEHNFLKETRDSLEIFVVSVGQWDQFNLDLEKRQKSNEQVEYELSQIIITEVESVQMIQECENEAVQEVKDAQMIGGDDKQEKDDKKKKEKKKKDKIISKDHLDWTKWPKIGGVYDSIQKFWEDMVQDDELLEDQYHITRLFDCKGVQY